MDKRFTDPPAAPAGSPAANEPPASRATRGAGERGFTLIELLVVITILGLLAAIVVPNVNRLLGSSRHKLTEQDIERVAGILDIYRLDVGSYPTTEQGMAALLVKPPGVANWNGPYLKGDDVAKDPWGAPYQYRSPSSRPNREFDLFTLGADGKAGGDGEAADVYN